MAKAPGVSKKIVVVGSSNTDMVIKTPRLPKPGETIIGGEFFMAAGGKGANQAVAAARAGGDVHFIARVGADVFGRQLLDGFVRDGIHVENILLDKDVSSGVALIVVAPDGENSIAVASGANARLGIEDVRRAKDVIASADIVLMQLESPFETVIEAAEIASTAGVPVILNPAPAQMLGDDLLKRLSFLTPNETEAEIMTGVTLITKGDLEKAADIMLDKGMKGVLITLGPKGVYVATPERKEVVPAFPVTPVDTTAAGDAFNGALAVALAEGRSLFDAAQFGNAAAAIATTKLGAQPSLPFRKDIERLMASEKAAPREASSDENRRH
ncbi:MAG: ribokinase [Candidatus Aminicenantes bacterium]|nr:ribokinase [Candidatus Aminicenantes bacterium]